MKSSLIQCPDGGGAKGVQPLDCIKMVVTMNVVGQKVIQPTIRGASLNVLEGFDSKENGVSLLRFQITKGTNPCRLISVTHHGANYYYIF